MSKQFICHYLGFEVYLDTSYHCTRLNLWGFASERALMRAMDRKLSQTRRRSA